MDAYTDFANVYDTFMDETPYDVWGDFIVELMNKFGVTKPAKSDTSEYTTEEDTEQALEEEEEGDKAKAAAEPLDANAIKRLGE